MRDCGVLIYEGTRTLFHWICSCLGFIFFCCNGNKVSNKSETRLITVGEVDFADRRKHNKIKTSKYSLLMFIPKNLSEQFRRVVNFYFLIVTVIAIVIDSPVSPVTSVAPLSFMVLVTAVKQGYEDWLRHKADNKVNNQNVEVIHNGVAKEVRNSTIGPGTLVRVKRGCEVPADLVLLCAAGTKGRCYVTTANLDGETNLKTLRVPPPLVGCSSDMLPPGMSITVPNPEANLYSFHGSLSIPGYEPMALSTDNLMLRGSRVKNTEWAIGCAVYTGEETKLALNSKFTSNKFSSCESAVNAFLAFFILLLLLEIAASMTAKILIERNNPEHTLYLGEYVDYSKVKLVLQDLFSFLLLYYYIIPMSLYVTIELYKFLGSLYIGWDKDLECSETGNPAVANTSDLNEELGQVEVLFSDKTGTLTKNQMIFKACSIRGHIYEERQSVLYDMETSDEANVAQTDIKFFLTILALCHCVQISNENMAQFTDTVTAKNQPKVKFFGGKKKTNKNGIHIQESVEINNIESEELNENNKFEYQGSSPDEKALVEAASRFGVSFWGEHGNDLLVKIGTDIEMYEKLQIIEFTSERRRMSIIVRDKDGNIWLYCKGAESAILPLCKDSVIIEDVNKDIDSFANRGLRTLAVAYRKISPEEYAEVAESGQNISSSASHLEQVTKRFSKFEAELTLVGATAVEDCLQDDVADTLAALKRAGIKTWVLTGDKVETAINVAQSCGHISENDRRMFLIGVTAESLHDQLDQCKRITKEQTYKDLTLVVDGTSMSVILGTPSAPIFADISVKCDAVLCCRLSPIQKAEIVKLIKHSPSRPITAAIGDGANDISMIQEAHVGFGIFGKEGHQAARCADFAFTKFSMVKKILLVLGHWYYQRLATLIHFFNYKNLVFGNIMVFFQIYSMFSTQSIYNSMYLTLYNLFFTSVPCLILSVTEQRWPAALLLENPTLYREISRNSLMTWTNFFSWVVAACYHSVIIYTFTWLVFIGSVISADAKTIDLTSYGAALFHLTIVVVSLKLWLQARYHTAFFIATTLLSIVVYAAFDIVYATVPRIPSDADPLGTYTRLLSSLTFWLLNMLVVAACLAPDFCARLIADKWGKRQLPNLQFLQEIFVTKL
ncbi:phospholipid-transporting ATPase IF [Achroia grisella]|uniref:phospholipid-transporting ATPase IF n=1 Tax=Achroia grisella TaxID=688607 RepID=UPI0027D3113A|nr:phospholipid-transporting ATPase IF [Achroia grisella]